MSVRPASRRQVRTSFLAGIDPNDEMTATACPGPAGRRVLCAGRERRRAGPQARRGRRKNTSSARRQQDRDRGATTREARETRKPRAPLPPTAPAGALTRSLITRQATTAPRQRAPSGLRRAAVEGRKPTTSPITAASRVMRPPAEPRVPVAPASIPIAIPARNSWPAFGEKGSTCRKPTLRL